MAKCYSITKLHAVSTRNFVGSMQNGKIDRLEKIIFVQCTISFDKVKQGCDKRFVSSNFPQQRRRRTWRIVIKCQDIRPSIPVGNVHLPEALEFRRERSISWSAGKISRRRLVRDA